MKSAKTLLFFTLQYPYGKKSETFIENEIRFLADAFERVIIFPREKNDCGIRELPENVEVNDVLIQSKKIDNYYKHSISSFSRFMIMLRIYGYTLIFDKKRRHYLKSGYFIYYLANALKDAKLLEDYLENSKLNQVVIYDYWFVNSTLSLAYLKSKNKIADVSCRAHGFDVFDDRWGSGSVPFRAYIFKHVKAVFAISVYNKNYIVNQINGYKSKVKVAYLGVKQRDVVVMGTNVAKEKNLFVVVSCANLFPFKQIERIPEVLKLVSLENKMIHWVHFGDGPEEEALLEAAQLLPATISFDYKGHVENSEVIDFYAKNQVDLFISLSLKEGLPVSMMEAQSFGIPILAYQIFGIPEIVTDSTGVLLETKATNSEISEKITQIAQNQVSFDKTQIKQFFSENFSAEKNFKAFTDTLLNG